MQRVEIDGGVAVGVDSSASSVRALIMAAEEAKRRQTVLHVVRAWSMRTAPRPEECPPGTVPSTDQYQQAVIADTQRIVNSKLGAEPAVPVELHIVHSPSPQALLSASRGADLLVVGHRGRGGFAGLMLGSVAAGVLHHASCPVAVLRGGVAEEEEG